MGQGVISATGLLSLGLYPVVASASIHVAKIFTSLVSGGFHYKLGNVNREILTPITVGGVAGGIFGAYGAVIMPVLPLKVLVSGILLIMGTIILVRFIRDQHRWKILGKHLAPDGGQLLIQKTKPLTLNRLVSMGALAGFIDAMGGGGWGPIATSGLVFSNGVEPRKAVGSVNMAEFFESVAVSVTFFALLANYRWDVVLALVVGGVISAPIAAYFSKKLPHRVLGVGIGILVILLSSYILLQASKLI